MTQTDGTVRYLYRDRADPSLLLAEEPWVGGTEYGQTVVRTREGFDKGQTEFQFYNGTLRKMILDGRQIVVKPVRYGKSEDAVAALWRQDRIGMVDEVRTIDIWKGGDRLRIPFGGLVNPNKTGALFMELGVVFLALLFLFAGRRRPVLAVLAAVLLLASVGLLFLTQSRGCFLGFVAGVALLLASHVRGLLTMRRIMVLGMGLLILGSLVLWLGGDRFTKGFLSQDPRTNRLTMWAEVPKMIADAPTGWGIGKAGATYVDWYQSFDTPLAVAELQNSHLTWLVEMGDVGRVGYVAIWLFALGLLTIWAFRDRVPLPLAAFVSLGTAACFTHELEEPVLWILPLLSLIQLARPFRPIGRRMLLPLATLAFVCAVGGLVGVKTWVAGDTRRLAILGDGETVRLNGAEPGTWILGDDMVLDGGYQIYRGKEMRLFFQAHTNAPAIGFAQRLSSLPEKVGTLVLAGEPGRMYLEAFQRQEKDLCVPRRLVFVSPPFSWKRIGEDLRAKTDVRVIVGRLAGRLCADYDLPPPWVRQVPGAELYIPNWLEMVTENKESGL